MQSTAPSPSENKEYTSPGPDDLQDCKMVRKGYKKDNPLRLALITFLEIFCDYMQEIRKSDKELSDKKWQDIAMGGWFYCVESIGFEYYHRYLKKDPKYKKGYWSFLDSGSTLYKLLLEKLKITKTQYPNDAQKLAWMNEFHKYFFRGNSHPSFDSKLQAKNLKLAPIKTNLITLMQHNFIADSPYVKKFLKAIPSEKEIDAKLETLYKDYMAKTKNDNRERKFLAQLAFAFSKIEDDVELNGHWLTRSRRVKLGFIFYIMKSIDNTYKFGRRAKGNSKQYDLCYEMLNNTDIDDIDEETQKECLSTFKNYINSYEKRGKLETDIIKQFDEKERVVTYIDSEVDKIVSQTTQMIEKLSAKPPLLSPGLLTAATFAALCAAVPGYGVGFAIGEGVKITDAACVVTLAIAKHAGPLLKEVLGSQVTYIVFNIVNNTVGAICERLFAKLFETLSMCLAALGLVGMKLVIYDFSAKTFFNLIKLLLNLNERLPKTRFVFSDDVKLFETYLDLPEEVLNSKAQKKLESLLSTTPEAQLKMFAHKIQEKIEPNLKENLDINHINNMIPSYT